MNRVSKFAFALALSAVSFAPHAFAKDEKADQNKKSASKHDPKYSDQFKKVYLPLLDLYNKKKDYAGAIAGLPNLRTALMNDDDRSEAGTFIRSLGELTNNSALKIEGADLVMSSAFTAPELKQAFGNYKAQVLYGDKKYPEAQAAFLALYDGGFRKDDIEVQIANCYSIQGKYAEALPWLRKTVEARRAAKIEPDAVLYGSAINYALKLKDYPTANWWLKERVREFNTPANWHDMLAILGQTTDFSTLELLDIARLGRLKSSMAYPEDYGLYVESATRFPTEIVGVLDEGYAKNIVPKTNLSIAEIYKNALASKASDIANQTLNEADARKNVKGYGALLTGDAFLSQANYAKALEMYQLAFSKGNLIDGEKHDQSNKAQLHLGMVKAYLKDYAGAKVELAKVTSGNLRTIADYWTFYVDQQLASAAPVVAPAPAAKPKG